MITDQPLAAPGLASYRYRGRYGWVMIGALGDADAITQAQRSVSDHTATPDRLQRWTGQDYQLVTLKGPTP